MVSGEWARDYASLAVVTATVKGQLFYILFLVLKLPDIELFSWSVIQLSIGFRFARHAFDTQKLQQISMPSGIPKSLFYIPLSTCQPVNLSTYPCISFITFINSINFPVTCQPFIPFY
jgi:hypothetical protein